MGSVPLPFSAFCVRAGSRVSSCVLVCVLVPSHGIGRYTEVEHVIQVYGYMNLILILAISLVLGLRIYQSTSLIFSVVCATSVLVCFACVYHIADRKEVSHWFKILRTPQLHADALSAGYFSNRNIE